MSEEDTQVVDSAETTTTEDVDLEVSTEEEVNDVSTEQETVKEKQTETAEQRRARIKRMYEREFGKQDKSEEKKDSNDGDERYTRLELKTEGITSKKAQDVVIEYIKEAKLIGRDVDIASALKSNVVKEAIAEIDRKTSAPAPSKRSGTGASDSLEYWVAQAKKGNWPRHDREMMRKLAKARIFTS